MNAVLKQIEYRNSGECSACGDLLMTAHGSATPEESLTRLEKVFEQHLTAKHKAKAS